MDKEKDLREAMAHLGEFVTDELREFSDRSAWGYLWRGRLDDGIREYRCSLCGNVFPDDGSGEDDLYCEYPGRNELKHGKWTECPACGRRVMVFDEWRGTNKIRLYRHFVEQWRKSAVDPGVVVAVGAEAFCFYERGGQIARLHLTPVAFAVFRYGRAGARYIHDHNGIFRRASRLNWLDSETHGARAELDEASVNDAIAGTQFERAWSPSLIVRNQAGGLNSPLMKMGILSSTPCMEYMVKLGFHELVRQKLAGNGLAVNNAVINWKGRSMDEVFCGIDRTEIKALRAYGAILSHEHVRAYRQLREDGVSWPADRVMDTIRTFDMGAHMMYLLREAVHRYGYRMQDELKYLLRTEPRMVGNAGLRDLIDYWAECDDLGVPVGDYRTRHPKNLLETHRETSLRTKYLKNQKFDSAIAERYPEINKALGYSACGLTLRPAQDTLEVIREGNELSHCVGRYCEAYAEGRAIIMVLRRDSEPDKPFHTVEMRMDGSVIQCRGFRNATAEQDKAVVDAFWAAYKARGGKRRTA